MCDLMLLPQCKWGLGCFGILHSAEW